MVDQPGPYFRPDAGAADRRWHRPLGTVAGTTCWLSSSGPPPRASFTGDGGGTFDRAPMAPATRPGKEPVMKKFINAPEDVVREALAGCRSRPPGPAGRLRQPDRGPRGCRRCRQGRHCISGGGSGHEPLHGGFVGAGMLDAACPGEVFTSPVPDQILAATKAVDGGAGVVHIVKNYTGDVLNFQMAAELASDDGIRVETVLVDDDVAVENSTWTAGRRGTGATLIVEKVAGRGGRGGPAARGGRRVRPAGQRELRRRSRSRSPPAPRRPPGAGLRSARGRDGGRRRHPR